MVLDKFLAQNETVPEPQQPFHLNSGQLFRIKVAGTYYTIFPVDGEVEYDMPGFSCGFVHFKEAMTGEHIGWCGTNFFEKNAVPVELYEPPSKRKN